ncbi:hypothetical protein CAC42_360 [Sphaceloma murrayae]|uniref:SnoaL-like domain-containing protein n=1 Tax=Sphaceloma murrayae TaxID=2082308 RepID=A0A2K1R0D0_9PEZI|nr:hypothetical protein CAC42_360 [Sphaceloma murrayae]
MASRRLPLYIACDGDRFDPIIISHWQEEGYQVSLLPFHGDVKTYSRQMHDLGDDLEQGESFVIVAYGHAAAICLEAATEPVHRLSGLIAYYPVSLPTHASAYQRSLQVVVHLASSQTFAPAFDYYLYPNTTPSFAEHDSDAFSKVSATLAWTRSLATVRKAFRIEVDLEKVWENRVALEFVTKDAAATMNTMVDEPYVNHVPTLTGGIGQEQLFHFYRDFFIPQNPPSLKVDLVSRTIGTDRVVDEMIISFHHTQEVPWMLPGVPATNRPVSVALVSIVSIRGGKLYHEHRYWDQASVLVQVGLLDPKIVPQGMEERGLRRLPVYGVEAAEKVLDESSHPSNGLLADWN